MLVFRPGQGPMQRTIVRCHRKVKRKEDRCPVQMSDNPLPEAAAPVPQPQVTKPCECGCGNPVPEGKRFFARQCHARHAQKFRSIHRNQPAPAPHSANGNGNGRTTEWPAATSQDDLELVFEALRTLRNVPPEVRRKALELLEAMDSSNEPG